MGPKKKLISRMALCTGGVLILAVVAGVAGLLAEGRDRRRWSDNRQREQEQTLERSRAYLADLAKRIDRRPVDQNLVSEVESRYFDEQAKGTVFVWAVGTSGDFLFGVPQSEFARLNAVYDRQVSPRLKEGVFVDRRTFLLRFVDDGEEIGMEALAGEATELVMPRERWRLATREREGSFVLSTPLKTPDGSALGSLYLKRTPARGDDDYRPDERVESVLAAAGGVAGGSFAFLWVLLPTWVYVDARERGTRRAALFAFLTVISSLVGLVVYLIARPEQARTLVCPGCAREVDGGAFCPHCGRDLSRSICPACRYPLKPDWAYCPSCRTEIRAQGTPPTEAG